MCGIAGCIQLGEGTAPAPDLIVQICDQMLHRGPDGQGYLFPDEEVYRNFGNQLLHDRPETILTFKGGKRSSQSKRNVFLGHRRLTILDLSLEAGQPMEDITGRVVVTFNGEIYNYPELREELEDLGFKFKTDHSDTEVLLNAYKAWGMDMLHRFNGMYAFCLWDPQEDLLILARDRMGIKPLYYTVHENILYFSSELKGLLVIPGLKKELEPTALHDFLTFLAVPPPRTLIKGIHKLGAGQLIRIKKGEISPPHQYYELLEQAGRLQAPKENEILEETRSLLKSAVRFRRRADVGYGAYLSGGLDSSANIAFLSEQGDFPVNAFSAAYNDDIAGYSNELPHARKVASKFGAKLFEINLDSETFFNFAKKAVWHLDEPISDAAAIPLYFLSKLAKDNGVTVCLGGEGSDEIFIGYPHWKMNYNLQKFMGMLPPFAAPIAHSILQIPPLKNKRPFYRGWLKRIQRNQPSFWGGTDVLTEDDKTNLLAPEFKRALGGYNSFEGIRPYWNRFQNHAQNKDFLNWMSFIDLNFRLPDLLLSRLDRMSMAASVEGRVPFLDHNLVEYAMSIPPWMKLKGNQEKYLLKKSMEPILPHEIIYRPKDGFSAPLHQLLGEKGLYNEMEKSLNNFNKEQGVFSPTGLTNNFGHNDYQVRWLILNIGSWWEQIQRS